MSNLKHIDLTNYKNLNDFYDYIEDTDNLNNLSLKSINYISDLFFNYYKIHSSTLKQKDVKTIFFEIKSFDYIISNGELISLASKTIVNEDSKFLSFLSARIKQSKNPLFLARYFHILYLTSKNKSEYLSYTLRNYLLLLETRVELPIFFNENLEVLKILYKLDFKANSDKIISFSFKLLEQEDTFSKKSFLEFLSKFIATNKSQFTKKQLNDFVSFCKKYFDLNDTTEDNNSNIYYLILTIAKQLDKALKRSYFKNLSLDSNENFTSNGKEIKFNHYLELFNSISNHKFENKNNQILPDLVEINRLFEDKYKDANQSIFNETIIIYDKNGQTSEHFTGYEEIKYYFFLSTYKNQYENNGYFEFIEKLFIENYENEIFTFDNFVSYFKKRTELRFPYLYQILEPTLKLFFEYLSTISNNKEDNATINSRYKSEPHFLLVPTLDSLSLKIELILRALNIGLGRDNISKFIRDKKGNNVERVKNIEDFLLDKNEPVNNILKEEDIFLFRFLLIEKAGYNLRHDVAHSLITVKENYHRKLLFLVVVSVIKMISYFEVEQNGK